jgi:hypothetical protein
MHEPGGIAPREAHTEGISAGSIAARRHAAHRLDAAGDHDIVCARHDALRGKIGRLLRRPATPVQRNGRYVIRIACGEPCQSPWDAGLFTYLSDAANHDVIDQGGVKVIAVDQCGENLGEEIDRVEF